MERVKDEEVGVMEEATSAEVKSNTRKKVGGGGRIYGGRRDAPLHLCVSNNVL